MGAPVSRVYGVARLPERRRAHENPGVAGRHERLLGRPLGGASRSLLHRPHTDRS